MNTNNRFDVYFSYWILIWFIISLFTNITTPILMLFISYILQLLYIIHNKKNLNIETVYIKIGNSITVVIKCFAIIYILLYNKKNINLITEIYYTIILFIIFNIYYYYLFNNIYNFSANTNIDEGPMVYLTKNLFILLNLDL